MLLAGVFFINIEDLFRLEQVEIAVGSFLTQYQALLVTPLPLMQLSTVIPFAKQGQRGDAESPGKVHGEGTV